MRVLIVGGGFAGVRAALKLANKSGLEVKLVSNKSYFEYHAALYRSATGRSPLEVAIPLRSFFSYARNVEVVEDTIQKIDASNHQLTGASGSMYRYDVLILAAGNVTQYFGIRGLARYSFGVKTIHEALELKRRIHEDILDGNGTERHYVVIGAGATGVELAAEMRYYIEKVRRRHKTKHQPYSVDLIEASDRVLPALPPDFSRKVERRLRKLGITLHLNTKVSAETYESIELPRGRIKTQTAVWTAGVANNPLFEKHKSIFNLDKRGKVVVDEHLLAAPDIYVLGDSAATEYSGMAQTAVHDADFVTANLLRLTRAKQPATYRPLRPIYAIPVGRRWSAVLWKNTRIYGFDGWVLRRLADLRLYLRFLPLRKALTAWHYGFTYDESCSVCRD